MICAGSLVGRTWSPIRLLPAGFPLGQILPVETVSRPAEPRPPGGWRAPALPRRWDAVGRLEAWMPAEPPTHQRASRGPG
jgi:hypothetical protein